MKMLDTNICIYTIKHKPESVIKRFTAEIPNGLCISSITLAELWHGVEKSSNPQKNATTLAKFLTAITILPFDDLAAIEYGNICADLQKKGTPIGQMDMMIAAHARAEKLVLVTNNTREFERVDELQLESWV